MHRASLLVSTLLALLNAQPGRFGLPAFSKRLCGPSTNLFSDDPFLLSNAVPKNAAMKRSAPSHGSIRRGKYTLARAYRNTPRRKKNSAASAPAKIMINNWNGRSAMISGVEFTVVVKSLGEKAIASNTSVQTTANEIA